MKLFDCLGHELKPGDIVAYPVLAGQSCQLGFASVIDWEFYSSDDKLPYSYKVGDIKKVRVSKVSGGSRWNRVHSWSPEGKIIILTKNARSLIKVDGKIPCQSE